MGFDAVILAGGAARRLGGADKATIEVGGRTLLARVLDAVAAAARVVVVGPRRPGSRAIKWVQERPPGGGPVHALAAGTSVVEQPLVVAVAVDLPFVTTAVIERLLAAVGDHDAAVVRDSAGTPLPLLGAYRSARLRARLEGLGGTAGAAMRDVLAGMDVVFVDDHEASLDCDTWEQVEAARKRE